MWLIAVKINKKKNVCFPVPIAIGREGNRRQAKVSVVRWLGSSRPILQALRQYRGR
jgi:hypothetical protein